MSLTREEAKAAADRADEWRAGYARNWAVRHDDRAYRVGTFEEAWTEFGCPAIVVARMRTGDVAAYKGLEVIEAVQNDLAAACGCGSFERPWSAYLDLLDREPALIAQKLRMYWRSS